MTLVNTPTHITNKLVVILMLHKCVFYFRYDLRIRYIPVDFMKRLKEDRTFLLYFYQQVSKHLQIVTCPVCCHLMLLSP